MRGGGLYISLLGCTCALVPPGRAWGHPEAPKPGRLRAPSNKIIGGEGGGKWVEANPLTPFPVL